MSVADLKLLLEKLLARKGVDDRTLIEVNGNAITYWPGKRITGFMVKLKKKERTDHFHWPPDI